MDRWVSVLTRKVEREKEDQTMMNAVLYPPTQLSSTSSEVLSPSARNRFKRAVLVAIVRLRLEREFRAEFTQPTQSAQTADPPEELPSPDDPIQLTPLERLFR